jgi:hypothetical protein
MKFGGLIVLGLEMVSIMAAVGGVPQTRSQLNENARDISVTKTFATAMASDHINMSTPAVD